MICVFPSLGSWTKQPIPNWPPFFHGAGDLEKQGDGVDQRANGNADLEGGSAVTDFCGARLDGGLELHIDYPSLKLNIAPENGSFQ